MGDNRPGQTDQELAEVVRRFFTTTTYLFPAVLMLE